MKKPELHIQNLQPKKISDPQHIQDQVLENAHIQCDIAKNFSIDRLMMEKTIVEQSSLQFSTFTHSELTDCIFLNCDLSNTNFSGAILYRCEFINCKMLGSNLSEVHLNNILFKECSIEMASFSNSNFKTVTINQCDLTNANIFECQLKNFKLMNSNIHGVNFTGTLLKNVDISTCTFEKLIVDSKTINQCYVNNLQAIGLAKGLLNIKIKE